MLSYAILDSTIALLFNLGFYYFTATFDSNLIYRRLIMMLLFFYLKVCHMI